MNEPQSRRLRTQPRRLLPLSLLLVLAVVLAWQRPWQARPVAITPHPVSLVPTPAPPTPTAGPDRVVPPPASVAATAARATPATPAVAPIAELAGAGSLLYLGFVDGHPGIVSVNADGSDRRLLVSGMYDTLAWSPDGSRFAAVGLIPGSGLTYQIAIFAADGRPLARFPFDNNRPAPLSWSPSSRFLLTSNLGGAGGPGLETWVLGDDGARLIAPPPGLHGVPWGWTPDERIAFLATTGTIPRGTQALLTANARGEDWRPVMHGIFSPLGWDATGTKFTFLGSTRINATEGPLDVLSTLDTAHNRGSTQASASSLATYAFGENGEDFYFAGGFGAPDGSHCAVILARRPGQGTPVEGYLALIFLDRAGQVSGAERLQDANSIWPIAWSPDSTRLVHFLPNDMLRVLDITGVTFAEYHAQQQIYGAVPLLDWSPDSQWIAYTDGSGITIATATGSARAYPLASVGIAPAWRPAHHP